MNSKESWIILAVVFSVVFHFAVSQDWKRVKLHDVKELTLRQGHMTNGHRKEPIPQLTCVNGVEGHPCPAFVPKVVQCYNIGSDGNDVQWECEADDMSNGYRFDKITVNCEGYDYPEDPYILKGSCGLEYTIARIPILQEKVFFLNDEWAAVKGTYGDIPLHTHATPSLFLLSLKLTILYIIILIIYEYYRYRTQYANEDRDERPTFITYLFKRIKSEYETVHENPYTSTPQFRTEDHIDLSHDILSRSFSDIGGSWSGTDWSHHSPISSSDFGGSWSGIGGTTRR